MVQALGSDSLWSSAFSLDGRPDPSQRGPLAIKGCKVPGIIAGDSNSRNLTVAATTNVKSDFFGSYGVANVTRGGGVVDALWLDGRKVTDRANICPSFSVSLGTHKVGPVCIVAEYEYHDGDFEDYLTGFSEYTDNTARKFQARRKPRPRRPPNARAQK